MKTVNADFNLKVLPSRLLWLLVLAFVLIGLAAIAAAWQERAKLHEAQASLQRSRVAQRIEELDVPVRLPKPYERSARELLRERQLHWPEALKALEATALEGATLRSFEANADDGTVRVEIVAIHHAKVLQYLEALNAGIGTDPTDIRWTLLQTQIEASSNSVVAVLAAKRAGSVAGERGNR